MELEQKREIMRAAVKAAQAHDFSLKNWAWSIMGIHTHPDFDEEMTDEQLINMILLDKFEKLLLFDFDFAKALFETEFVCIGCEGYSEKRIDGIDASICCNSSCFTVEWKDQLAEMVTSENPIERIEEYLERNELMRR